MYQNNITLRFCFFYWLSIMKNSQVIWILCLNWLWIGPHCFVVLFLEWIVYLRSSVSNGRPYCYSSVSFSLLLLLLLLLLLFFFLLDFSKTPGLIFMKLSGMVYVGLAWPKQTFQVMTSLPVGDIDDFLILRLSFCARSPKLLKISSSNFHGR